MKSDQEFLKGIYEKAEELRHNTETDEKIPSGSQTNWMITMNKRPTHIYKYGSIAAMLLIVFIVTVFVNLPKTEEKPNNIEPFGLNGKDTRNIDFTDIMYDSATDIIEIGYNHIDNQLKIIEIYKGNSSTADVLNSITTQNINIPEDQTVIVFFSTDTNGLVITNIFRSELTEKNSFINEYGDKITREELDDYKQK